MKLEGRYEIVESHLSLSKLREIQDLFWLIYADETKDRPLVCEAAYCVLVALENYRKSLDGKAV